MIPFDGKRIFIALTLALIFGAAAGKDQERGVKKRVAEQPALTHSAVPARSAQPNFIAGNYHALLIGNNAYRDPQKIWGPLKTAVNDAKIIADILAQRYGFKRRNIHLITDATRSDILGAFNQLYQKVQDQDSILIYYAGHGHLNNETEEAYWIPVDAQGMDEANFIVHSELRNKLSLLGKKALHTVMISDSCFSGALLGSVATRGPQESSENFDHYLRKVSARKSVQVIAAGGREFVDDDYQRSGHSPFTYFLLQELQQSRESVMTASDLSHYLRRAVGNNSRQTPEAGPLRDAGDAGGEFVFVNQRAAEQPETIALATPAPYVAQPQQPGAQIIVLLLDQAEKDFAAKRFISPNGNNALEKWRKVLALDADNFSAKQGMQRITDELLDEADAAILRKNWNVAERWLQNAKAVDARSPRLADTETKLASARAAEAKPKQKPSDTNTRFFPGF